jgi:hypothetical protein
MSHEEGQAQTVRRKGDRYDTVSHCPHARADGWSLTNAYSYSIDFNAFVKKEIMTGEIIQNNNHHHAHEGP